MKLIIFVLIVWGCFNIFQSKIFNFVRFWIEDKITDLEDAKKSVEYFPKYISLFEYLQYLLQCPTCLGVWTGLFLSLLGNIFPSVDVSPLKGYENIPFNAILASGGAYIIQMVMENKFPEPEDDDDPDTDS